MKHYIDGKKAYALEKMITILKQYMSLSPSTIVICIGSDKATGDAYGPMVGHFLKEKGQNFVYGCLNEPIHALNLTEKLTEIKKIHETEQILVVDACLGSAKNIGKMIVSKGALRPGSAFSKQLPSLGDIQIKGVVNELNEDAFLIHKTPFCRVYNMAKLTAQAIECARKEQSGTQALMKSSEA